MKTLVTYISFILFLSLNSCGVLPYGSEIGSVIGGQNKSYQADYSLTFLKNDKEISYNKVKQFLESKKFNYEGEIANSFKFSKNFSELNSRISGQYNTSTIHIKIENDKLSLNISNFGNYGWGTKEKTDAFFKEIESNYLK